MQDPHEPTTRELVLRVAEARHHDVGRGLARIPSEDFERLGITPGQTIEILGHRRTVARAFPMFGSERRPEVIQIDGLIRENARVGLDDVVRVRPIPSAPAMRVTLQPVSGSISAEASRYLSKWLEGVPVLAGDTVRIWLPGARAQDYVILETEPEGPVIIQLTTACEIAPTPVSEGPPHPTYEDIGGLKREIAHVRELVELPLKHPAIFESVGLQRPRGILLCGPAGVGKSLLARVVAASCHAHFLHTTGPDLISRSHRHGGLPRARSLPSGAGAPARGDLH
jgi:transitional endoplasmic reticulum ATPase